MGIFRRCFSLSAGLSPVSSVDTLVWADYAGISATMRTLKRLPSVSST